MFMLIIIITIVIISNYYFRYYRISPTFLLYSRFNIFDFSLLNYHQYQADMVMVFLLKIVKMSYKNDYYAYIYVNKMISKDGHICL